METIKALKREGLPVELYFANGESDPYAVDLAGKLNGYVIGKDSDFVIFNAEGYKGYILLDELLWDTSISGDPGGRFSGGKRGIIPPEVDVSQISLTCSVTSPVVLASHLQLPVSFLPLLGALAGWDNSLSPSPPAGPGGRSLFFDKGVPSSRRITQVSNAIRDATQNSPQSKKTPEGSDGIIDLIRSVIHTLLPRATPSLAPNEESNIIEKIFKSTQLYVIPLREDGALQPPGPSCLLGNPEDGCFHGRGLGEAVRRRYLDGYRSGDVNPEVLNLLHTGTMWARPFLEDPQKETAHRSVGRPIREWIYAILNDGVGLPVRPGREGSEVESGVDEGGEGTNKIIVEYIRRGPRFGPEELRVRVLQELLEEVEIPLNEPIQLAPESTRLRLFLAAIGAEAVTERLKNISPEQIVPTLAARWVVSWLYIRATEAEGDMDRFAEKWTKSEVKALLLAFIRPTAPHTSRATPEIQERHIQLTAQVLVSIETIIFLAQVLLLDLDRCMPLNLVVHFSGRRFHQLLNDGQAEISSSQVLDPLVDVVTAGLDAEAFGDEAFNKQREGGWQQKGKGPPRFPPRGGKLDGKGRGGRGRGRGNGTRDGFPRRGMFDALAGV